MKRLLLCGYDDAMKELGDLTSPLMQSYASRHAYDFKCSRIYSTDVMAYWQKLYKVRDELDHYDEVHWMDSDIIITNPDFSFPEMKLGLHVSRDWGVDAIEPFDFSSCHFIASGEEAIELFERAIHYEKEWDKSKLYDQDALRLATKSLEEILGISSYVRVYERRYFNSVPVEVHPSTPEPWESGDFSAHLTMLTMKERVELFHKIRDRSK